MTLHINDAILNVRKPIGWTSNDVVRRVKKMFPEIKVGHAGTLDPFADGVLLVCTGKATKQVSRLMELEKAYRAVFQFGIETDTADINGTISRRQPPNSLTSEKIIQVLPRFRGEIDQSPPVYSAVHIEGKRAYHLVRSGEKLELEKRRVHIYQCELVGLQETCATFDIVCAKGVYIRSLAVDIAQAIGEIAFVKKLTRTRIGEYQLENSLNITDVKKNISTFEDGIF